MKTKILVTLFFAIYCLPVMAQNSQKLSAGITAGASTGSVKISGINRFDGYLTGDNIFGVEGGFFAKIKINPIYIKPSAIIQYKSGAVDVVNAEGEAYTKSDFKMTRLETPLTFGINVIGPLNVEAGPVYNHILSVTDRFSGYTADIPQNGVGYRAGLNAEFGRFAAAISYQAIKNISTSKGTFDLPDEVILSASYNFGNKRGTAPYGR